MIDVFKNWIDCSKNIVFFGGAGVSTESGIPDFRSVDGLYRKTYDYPPETVLSLSFFLENPSYFYRFYRDKMLCLDAKPNACHKALAALEKAGKLSAVITQNIDGLHQKAGSQTVYELHGSIHRNYCMRCNKPYSASFLKESEGIARCTCGGIIKPDVVLYEEALDSDTLAHSIAAIQEADMLIVGGTSLSVYPAAGLIQYYRGKKLVLINQNSTGMDHLANLILKEKIGELFSKLEL